MQYQNHPKVSFFARNDVNSGSPFRQWKKGIGLAKGELIWIAESDDWADLDFLKKAVQFFFKPKISIVSVGTMYVDANSNLLGLAPVESVPGFYDGNDFCVKYMYRENSILNASAVLFRRQFVDVEVMDAIGEYRLSGDHLFWAHLMKDREVCILGDVLNYFRYHEKSVRSVESKKLTSLKEGVRIKLWIESIFDVSGISRREARRQVYLSYFKLLRRDRQLKDRTDFAEVFNFLSPLDSIKALIRFVFFVK